jgi:prevent-host-death family protein
VKSIDEAEAQTHLDEILNDVQRQPVVIRRQGREVAIVVSMADYERLRASAVREFLVLSNDVAREASAAGLTEERLRALLDND